MKTDYSLSKRHQSMEDSLLSFSLSRQVSTYGAGQKLIKDGENFTIFSRSSVYLVTCRGWYIWVVLSSFTHKCQLSLTLCWKQENPSRAGDTQKHTLTEKKRALGVDSSRCCFYLCRQPSAAFAKVSACSEIAWPALFSGPLEKTGNCSLRFCFILFFLLRLFFCSKVTAGLIS